MINRIVNEKERVYSLTGPEIAKRIVQCIVAEELREHAEGYTVYVSSSWGIPRLEDPYVRIVLVQQLKASGFRGVVSISYTDKILPGIVEIRQAGRDPASRERSTDLDMTIDETTGMTDEQWRELRDSNR